MSKYYKVEDPENVICEAVMKLLCVSFDEGYDVADEVLKNLPTIDIVHCGECKCCRDELIEEHMPLYIYCEKWDHETDFDSFCSAGEWVEE